MRTYGNWRGLYLIGVLVAGLLVADGLAPLSPRGHTVLTAGIVLLALALTLLWTETHSDLVETSGVDAWARGDELYRARLISEGGTFVLPKPEAQQPQTAGANSADMWYTRRRNEVKV
jgi:hypothetical protein